ncbi:MAG: hypothetical protein KDK40_05170, partial [Chlamydiia bacterium]|nr:hypothetical protein [Chlamydiia bacterium]
QQLADSLLRNEHPVHIDAERRERLKQLILSLWLTLAGEITHQQELRSLSNRLLTQMKMENVDPIPKAIEELVSECLHRLVTNYRLHRELDRDICLEFNLSTAPAISHSVYFFKGDALHIQIKDEPTAYAWTSMDHALHRRPETTQILHEVGQSLMLLLNNYRLLPTESSEKAQLGSHPLLNCNHELFLRLEKITPARSS